jgi:hypothetical protein
MPTLAPIIVENMHALPDILIDSIESHHLI